MPVGPAEEHAPIAEELGMRQTLRVRFRRLVRGPGRARLAGARAPERPERKDAVVVVAPHDAERVPAHLGELLDVRRVPGHPRTVVKRPDGGKAFARSSD